jgi:hypothetical protein
MPGDFKEALVIPGNAFPLQEPSSTLPLPYHVHAFGDSYSDNSNFYQLDPGAFDSYYWQGRSSNGPAPSKIKPPGFHHPPAMSCSQASATKSMAITWAVSQPGVSGRL